MFIAANANNHPSVRRSGRAGCDLSFTSASAPPNGEGVFCCTKTINISPLTGRRQEPICRQRRATGLSLFGCWTVVGVFANVGSAD
jgi:hypothetical protein